MDLIFGHRRSVNKGSLLIGKVKGRGKGKAEGNMVSAYQEMFFSKFNFLILYLLMSKCSAYLVIPITSTEIVSTQLCPNPIDWQEPFTSLFPYRFFPNNVVVMDLVRGAVDGNSSWSPCIFKIGGPDTGVRSGQATLLILQQRQRPITFSQKCSRLLEFPGRWGEENPNMSCVVTEEDPNPAELNLDIRIMGQVKWETGGKLIFDLPLQSTSAPSFLIALFRITTQVGTCELQIQQFYWSRANDSWSCDKTLRKKLLNNICGRIPCSKQQAIIHELKGYPVKEPLLIDAVELSSPDARIKTIGYFLKGLLLPLIISLSASIAYIIWRRRMKAAANLIEGVSLGTQTGQSQGREEEGVLIHFEEEEEDEAKDKPPTYDSLLEPPSYEQATSPVPQLSPTHLFEIELERELLLKTPPLDNPDPEEDKTLVLTPTRSLQGSSGFQNQSQGDDEQISLEGALLPPPPFQ